MARNIVTQAVERWRGLTLTDEELQYVLAAVRDCRSGVDLTGVDLPKGGFSEYCPVTVPMLQYYGFRPGGGGGWESPNKVFLVRIGADKASVIAGSRFRDIPGPRHLQDLRNMAQVLGDPLPDFVELRLARRDVLALVELLRAQDKRACAGAGPAENLGRLEQLEEKLLAAAGQVKGVD